jgi:hypothetical protein
LAASSSTIFSKVPDMPRNIATDMPENLGGGCAPPNDTISIGESAVIARSSRDSR